MSSPNSINEHDAMLDNQHDAVLDNPLKRKHQLFFEYLAFGIIPHDIDDDTRQELVASVHPSPSHKQCHMLSQDDLESIISTLQQFETNPLYKPKDNNEYKWKYKYYIKTYNVNGTPKSYLYNSKNKTRVVSDMECFSIIDRAQSQSQRTSFGVCSLSSCPL